MSTFSVGSISNATNLARSLHSGQTLSTGEDYFDGHIIKVILKVNDWIESIDRSVRNDVLVAALLHDAIEDTPATISTLLENGISDYAAFLVDCVTDEPAPNRKMRKLTSYWKIRRDDNALVIKLADRIVNVQQCIDVPGKYGKMYLNEAYTFKCALFSPRAGNHIHGMWNQLEELYSVLEHRLEK